MMIMGSCILKISNLWNFSRIFTFGGEQRPRKKTLTHTKDSQFDIMTTDYMETQAERDAALAADFADELQYMVAHLPVKMWRAKAGAIKPAILALKQLGVKDDVIREAFRSEEVEEGVIESGLNFANVTMQEIGEADAREADEDARSVNQKAIQAVHRSELRSWCLDGGYNVVAARVKHAVEQSSRAGANEEE